MQQSKKERYFTWYKKKYTVKTQFMVNNHGIIIHKTDHKKKEADTTMISIKRIIL